MQVFKAGLGVLSFILMLMMEIHLQERRDEEEVCIIIQLVTRILLMLVFFCGRNVN